MKDSDSPSPEKTISDIIAKTIRPWEYEPDLYEWKYKDMDCIARRNVSTGTWCGYVDIPSEKWAVLLKALPNKRIDEVDDLLFVHGGITFGDYVLNKDVMRLGFDCAHAGDVLPKETFAALNEGGVYRTLDFVIFECERMADQIIELVDGKQKP